MKIFLVTGEHPTVPGLRLGAHLTRESAITEAVANVQLIRDDTPAEDMPSKITAENWESALSRLQDWHGAAFCEVTIREVDLKGVEDVAPEATSAGVSLEAFSFDGFGINDAKDPHKPRLATFSAGLLGDAPRAQAVGNLLQTAPELLTATEALLRQVVQTGAYDDAERGEDPGLLADVAAARAAVAKARRA